MPEHHRHLYNTNTVNRNNATLAGLDRSNGDYTVIFEIENYKETKVITQLFEKSREHFDIVYLRTKTRKINWLYIDTIIENQKKQKLSVK